MSKPREFWIDPETGYTSESLEYLVSSLPRSLGEDVRKRAVFCREVVPMPSEDDVSGLAMQYCASAEYPTGHAGFIEGFKKALELVGYKKGSSDE